MHNSVQRGGDLKTGVVILEIQLAHPDISRRGSRHRQHLSSYSVQTFCLQLPGFRLRSCISHANTKTHPTPTKSAVVFKPRLPRTCHRILQPLGAKYLGTEDARVSFWNLQQLACSSGCSRASKLLGRGIDSGGLAVRKRSSHYAYRVRRVWLMVVLRS